MSVINVKVVHIRPKYQNLKEWIQDPNNVYIGRGRVIFIDNARYPAQDSIWCNPFKIGTNGNREEVLNKYNAYIRRKITSESLNLDTLRGKQLGCWCKPEPCHGDILLELLNEIHE